MFEHAVVAADLSANWSILLERLPRLRRAGIQRLTLIHVLAPGMPGTGRQDERLREESSEQLRQAGDWLAGHGFTVGHEVLTGEPSVAIDDYLEQADASLVIVGRHSHGRLHTFFRGSTLYDLARSAGRPIWLEPLDTEPADDGPLLLASNGSQGARSAEERARELQAGYQAAVALIVDEGQSESDRVTALQHMESSLPGFSIRVEQGKVAPVINAVAQETGAALIVLGRSSHGSLLELLWGSTAEQLCLRPPTSVLLIPSAPD